MNDAARRRYGHSSPSNRRSVALLRPVEFVSQPIAAGRGHRVPCCHDCGRLWAGDGDLDATRHQLRAYPCADGRCLSGGRSVRPVRRRRLFPADCARRDNRGTDRRLNTRKLAVQLSVGGPCCVVAERRRRAGATEAVKRKETRRVVRRPLHPVTPSLIGAPHGGVMI